jgi:hypothetical protein
MTAASGGQAAGTEDAFGVKGALLSTHCTASGLRLPRLILPGLGRLANSGSAAAIPGSFA